MKTDAVILKMCPQNVTSLRRNEKSKFAFKKRNGMSIR